MFGMLGICLYIMKYLGDGTQSKHKTHVLYTLYTHTLKVILCNILNNFAHETKLHSIEFSTCGIMLAFKKFQILEHCGFQIFRLGMPRTRGIEMSHDPDQSLSVLQ
jgi:hypothetical protein